MMLVLGTLLIELRLSAAARGVPRPVLRGMVMVPEDGARMRVREVHSRVPRPSPRLGGAERTVDAS